MKKKLQTSLIISTYNWPSALELVINSITKQTVLPNEIIIADDGSTETTKELIVSLQNTINIPIVHCWQPDEGFRLALIRNKALELCKYPYVIQIDGDVICHPHFIADHLRFAAEGFFLTGKRINLNDEDTTSTLQLGNLDMSENSYFKNKVAHRYRSEAVMCLIKPIVVNNFINKGVLGCNMSFWLSDARAIGGYNDKFIGWGKEDDEFAHRLLKYGIKKRGIRFGAIQYHLNHSAQSRDHLSNNENLLNQTKTQLT